MGPLPILVDLEEPYSIDCLDLQSHLLVSKNLPLQEFNLVLVIDSFIPKVQTFTINTQSFNTSLSNLVLVS